MSARIVRCAVCLALAAGEARAVPPAAGAKVERARVDVEQSRERAEWAERMAKKGYMTPAQARAERAKLADAEAALLVAEDELKGLRPEGGFFAGLARHVGRVRTAGAKVEAAKAHVELTRERAAWADRMVKLKYMSPTQAQVERARAADAADALRRATEEFDALRPKPEKK